MSGPKSFATFRDLPVVGRAPDWGMGPHAASEKTWAPAHGSPA